MSRLLIVESKKLKNSPPQCFRSKIEGDKLLLPEDVARATRSLSINTAEEFVSYLYAFPLTVASALGWQLDSVVKARKTLVKKLRGRVSNEILQPPKRAVKGLGAFPP